MQRVLLLLVLLTVFSSCSSDQDYQSKYPKYHEITPETYAPFSPDRYSSYPQGHKYPRYDPSADNPPYPGETYTPFKAEKYQGYKYPRYDPGADNPYYPPSTYAPSPKKYYKYPRFDPSADNPPYPHEGNKRMFDKPLFDEPMFRN